jgi:putative phosphoribosyl transferase
MMAFFKNRSEAGKELAKHLMDYANRPDVLVLGLPRGGVPVAFEVAKALNAPLDVFLVRKLGVPGHEELALGAIASGGVRVLNHDLLRELSISENALDSLTSREQEELHRREQAFRGDRPMPDVSGRTVILVDDGLATGASMYAAVVALREHHPDKIIVAVPTASPETCAVFEGQVDSVICAHTPSPFLGVGMWYDDFSQTSDEEVRRLLQMAAEEHFMDRS